MEPTGHPGWCQTENQSTEGLGLIWSSQTCSTWESAILSQGQHNYFSTYQTGLTGHHETDLSLPYLYSFMTTAFP